MKEQRIARLTEDMRQHIATCTRCRGGLLLLVRGLNPAQLGPPPPIDCTACQDDLAAFIELEALDPVEATRRYAGVWWHLLFCATCAHTYDMVQKLLRAQGTEELPALSLNLFLPSAPQPIQDIRITRQMLAFALPIRHGVSMVMRGEGDQSYVLYEDSEDEPEPRSLTIEVEEQPDGRWQMRVMVIPPSDGLLALMCGELRMTSPFDPGGVATIPNIPQDALTSSEAPDLEIRILPLHEY